MFVPELSFSGGFVPVEAPNVTVVLPAVVIPAFAETRPEATTVPAEATDGKEVKLETVATRVSVMFAFVIVVVLAATAIVHNEIELDGVAGAVGDGAAVPVNTVNTTWLVEPV